MVKAVPEYLTEVDFGDSTYGSQPGDGETPKANVWIDVVKYRVPEQTAIELGRGGILGGQDLRGFLKIVLKDSTGTQITQGKIMLCIRDFNEYNETPVIQVRANEAGWTTVTVESDKLRLGKTGKVARANDYIVIKYRAESDWSNALEFDNCEFQVPVIKYVG